MKQLIAVIAATNLMLFSSLGLTQTVPNGTDRFENVTTIQLDFGRDDSPSGWNAITGTSKTNLLTGTGDISTVNFERINSTFFSGLSTSGTLSQSASYPEKVAEDGFFSRNKPYSEFKLTGLDATANYTVNFFASTKFGSNISYQTAYTVTGIGAETAYLEALSNDDEQASVTVKPSSLGELTVRITAGPDNTSSQGMFYINALTIDVDNTVDSDGDGVNDDEDDFPYDPAETSDRDGDGVGDNADFFPNDPERFEKVTTIQLDFGRDDSPSGWNAITGASKTGLLTETGDSSTVNFERINGTFFSGLSTSGTLSPSANYPENVGSDGFFSRNKPYSEFKLTGLDATTDYTLNFFSSTRWGSNISYQTAYTVTGSGAETAYLEALINNDEQASVTVKPSSLGELTVRIEAGPDNTSSQSIFYINALTIDVVDNTDLPPIVELPDSPEIATVTSGVAPLAVSFDAGAEGEAFHNRLYQWNFGDETAGNWVGVEDSVGLPKNTDTGPINGHLYTQPGTYVATLRVSDSSGEIPSLAKQVTITVLDPNEVFAGEKTKCVSIVGDFEGCPNGAERLTYNGDQLYNNFRTLLENNRVLLHRGERWIINATLVGNQLSSNVYLSAYGNCVSPDSRGICENAPILDNHSEERKLPSYDRGDGDSSGPSMLRFSAQLDNILIENIHFTANHRKNQSISMSDNISNVVFHRLKLTVVNGLYLNEARDYALIDSDMSGGHSTIVYVGGRNLIVKGNHIHDSYSAHLLRLMSPYKSIIAHNILHGVEVDPQRISSGSQVLKLHGKRSDYLAPNSAGIRPYTYRTENGGLGVEPTFSQYTIVANNFFGKGDAWVATIYPTNSRLDELIRDVVFEKNMFTCAYGNVSGKFLQSDTSQKNTCVQMLSIQGQDITVRNNVFDLEDSGRINPVNANETGYNSAIAVTKFSGETAAPAPTNVKVYNNSIKTPTNVNYIYTPEWFKVDVDATNIEFSNNLINKPNSNNNYYRDDSGIASFSNNLFLDAPAFTDAANVNILQRDYRFPASSPAKDTGITLPEVTEDFIGALRSEGVMDVGAYAD